MGEIKKKYFLFWLIFITGTSIYSQTYVLSRVGKGEGALSLLRKYDLERYSCNISEFYKINKLNTGDPLILNRDYKLPIVIRKYDGKSIRTTLANFDLVKALEVESFNKEMMQRNIKPLYFISNTILW